MKKYTKLVWVLSSLVTLFVLLSVAGCKKAKFGDPVILITGTDVNPVVKFPVESAPSQFAVTATSTEKAPEDIAVTFALDTAAVARYNKENRTTYSVIPAAAIAVSNLSTTIKAGSSASSAVNVKIISTTPLIDGRSYLIPLSITNVTGGDMAVLESSRTVFLRVARIYNFNAVSMNNATGGTTGAPGSRGLFNGAFLFSPQTPELLPNFTLEIKNLIYDFRGGDGNSNPQPIQTLASWTNLSESKSIGLRYGELGNPNNSLQLIGSLGSAFAYGFNPNQWYMLSITYDGNKGVLYVDGNKAAEVSGSMVLEFSRMQFGQVWGGYHTRQYVNGRIAECRVWSRALTASEIKLNLCGADPTSAGLLAYWKLNEGSGSIFRNSATSGSKYDMDWRQVYWDLPGSGNLNVADKSSYVTWTNDNLNKCSQ